MSVDTRVTTPWKVMGLQSHTLNGLKGGIWKMDTITMSMDDYMRLYEDIKRRVSGSEVAATVLLQELAKDRRMSRIRSEKQHGDDESATEKQMAYLRRLGVAVPESLSKRKASEMIDAAREREIDY